MHWSTLKCTGSVLLWLLWCQMWFEVNDLSLIKVRQYKGDRSKVAQWSCLGSMLKVPCLNLTGCVRSCGSYVIIAHPGDGVIYIVRTQVFKMWFIFSSCESSQVSWESQVKWKMYLMNNILLFENLNLVYYELYFVICMRNVPILH